MKTKKGSESVDQRLVILIIIIIIIVVGFALFYQQASTFMDLTS